MNLTYTSQGLVSNLTLAADVLEGWITYSLSIDEAISQGLLWKTDSLEGAITAAPPSQLSPPAFYVGSFAIPEGIPDLPQDTYIYFPGWRKVSVNMVPGYEKKINYAFYIVVIN